MLNSRCMQASAVLTSRKVGNFSTCTKYAPCTLVQNISKWKGFDFGLLGLSSFPPCAPVSQGKSLQQGSTRSHTDSSMVVPSHLPQHILLSQHQYSALSTKFHAYKAKQRIQVTPSSLLCNVRSFLGKNAFAVGAGETMQCFQRVRVPRVTESIVPCSSALSLYGHQFFSKALEAGGGQRP